MKNKVSAYIPGGSTVTTLTSGDGKLRATDSSTILAVGGGLAGPGAGGPGGAPACLRGAAGRIAA